MPRTPIHLRPTAPLAERVLLPGDPGRALALAQLLTDGPKMFNHHRGLWGYTAPAKADGEPLTIQATGMGGPSAAIVLEELCDLGVRRAVRVGTCGALAASVGLGALLAADAAVCADGTSRALGAGEVADADPGRAAALAAGADVAGRIATTDVFYDDRTDVEDAWRAAGCLAVEMEAAALFAVGARREVPVGCLLLVTDVVGPPRSRIADDDLEAAVARLGDVALAALPPG